MKISIIVLNYNTKKITAETIKSVYKYPPDVTFELIVVDNASTDGSRQYLTNLKKKYSFRFIENKRNEGFAKGNNLGIRSAKGTDIILLNSDTKVTRGALSKMYEYSRKLPSVGVIGAQLLNSDDSVQASVYRLPTFLRTVKHYWLNDKTLLDKYAPQGNIPIEVESVVGAAMLISRDALNCIGLLNEKYFIYFEDLDYCRAVKENGLKVYYIPEAKIYHLHGASGKNLASNENQWRRLIPSSKVYHGIMVYYLITVVIKVRQQFDKLNKHV